MAGQTVVSYRRSGQIRPAPGTVQAPHLATPRPAADDPNLAAGING
jgi:hypothetical protein